MSSLILQGEKINRTGVGVGVFDGVRQGAVKKHVFGNWNRVFPCGHILNTAETAMHQVATQLRQIECDKEFLQRNSRGRSGRDMVVASGEWTN